MWSRPWMALVGWSAIGCGGGAESIDAAGVPHDGAPIDARTDAATDAAPDAAIDAVDARSVDAPPCTFFVGVWETSSPTFLAHIAPATLVGFETRGDGATAVVPGVVVPPDEYLACCGVRIEVIGPPGTSVVWGGAVADRSVRVVCPGGSCPMNVGIDLTYTPPVSAAGADYVDDTDVAVFATAGGKLAERDAHGGFIGYESAVQIASVEHTYQGGVELTRLAHRPCP